MKNLWGSSQVDDWERALRSYDSVIEQQGVKNLAARDSWYRHEFPGLVSSRSPVHLTLDELVQITEWKMARGVWRARNLTLVRGNDPEEVLQLSTRAFRSMPDLGAPIAALSKLAGVGPATASAAAAAVAPEHYPFFDEIVAGQIPQAQKLVFNLKYYKWYAGELRQRAAVLGGNWTPARVEQAIWANAGGKAGATGAIGA